MEDGCLGCLRASTVASRPAPMAGDSRNTAISPHPKLIWPGTRHSV